ncbi:SAM-dependent methyltransferase [Embleya sp. NPDC050493]|uniref:SAM-dependent methyltransferase n=1 Tax=Embleya sp. NPDC050493 TaxID=3363989 RepID=UPI00379BA629
MSAEKRVVEAIDVDTPSVARMYDWLLGGTDNYLADRDACRKLLEIAPSTQALARINRAFLRRVVRHLAAECGIRQFIDHGSGLPTQDNVHEIAQSIDRASRVVYVDLDPIVLAHGRVVLQENEDTAVIRADMRHTDTIFAHPQVERLIRLDEPVAALFVSVLHCIPDKDDPAALIRRVAARLPSGSYMVICQLVSDDAAVRDAVTDFMAHTTPEWGRVRAPDEVRAYFDGMDIVDPGLVEVSLWRPDSQLAPRQRTKEWQEWGGVARVR